MKSKIIIVLYLLVISMSIGGCITQDTNGKWHMALSKNTADTIEGAAETTTSVLSLLSLFVPGMAGVAGIAAGATGAYKKMKPSLVKNKAVSKHVVSSLEHLKEAQPELWDDVKEYIADNCNADIDAAIKEVVNIVKQVEKTGGK